MLCIKIENNIFNKGDKEFEHQSKHAEQSPDWDKLWERLEKIEQEDD